MERLTVHVPVSALLYQITGLCSIVLPYGYLTISKENCRMLYRVISLMIFPLTSFLAGAMTARTAIATFSAIIPSRT